MKIYISLWFQPITEHYASGSQARVYSPSPRKPFLGINVGTPSFSARATRNLHPQCIKKHQFSKNWLTIRVFWFSSYKDSKYLKGHGSLVWNGIMWHKHIINWIRGRFIRKKSVSCFIFSFPHLRPPDDINICLYVVCSICFEPSY